MKKRQERITSDNVGEYQAMLEAVSEPWALEHEQEPGNAITFFPPDLVNNPEQCVRELITPAAPLPNLPEKMLLLGLHYGLAVGLGRNAIRGWLPATRMVRDVRQTPASADSPNGPSVAEQILLDVDSGLNDMLVLPHQDRTDTAKALAVVTIATSRPRLITDNNFLPVNPLMKFEKYRGKKMVDSITKTGSAVWVFPQSPGAGKRDIPKKLLLAVNGGSAAAMGEILSDDSRGTISSVALTQAGMIQTLDPKSRKLQALDFPPTFDRGTASALRLTHRVLPIAFLTDPQTGLPRWEIGNFINRDSIEGETDSEIDSKFMDTIMLDLQERMERIARVPVKYCASEATLALRNKAGAQSMISV